MQETLFSAGSLCFCTESVKSLVIWIAKERVDWLKNDSFLAKSFVDTLINLRLHEENPELINLLVELAGVWQQKFHLTSATEDSETSKHSERISAPRNESIAYLTLMKNLCKGAIYWTDAKTKKEILPVWKGFIDKHLTVFIDLD